MGDGMPLGLSIAAGERKALRFSASNAPWFFPQTAVSRMRTPPQPGNLKPNPYTLNLIPGPPRKMQAVPDSEASSNGLEAFEGSSTPICRGDFNPRPSYPSSATLSSSHVAGFVGASRRLLARSNAISKSKREPFEEGSVWSFSLSTALKREP